MAEVSVKIEGGEKLAKWLGDFAKLDFQPEMDDIGRDLVSTYSGPVFASRGGVIGASWAGLKTSTLESKAKRYPGRPPLVATGQMRGGFTHDASKQEVKVSNPVEHFKYHQMGTSRIPARKMMAIGPMQIAMAVDKLKDGLKRLAGS